MSRKHLLFLLVPSVFFLDRILKILTVRFLAEGEGFPVVPGVFHVTRVNNTGAAFGILKDQGPVLVAVSVVCIVFLGIYLLKNTYRGLTLAAWSLVLAGALGNLYDRVRFGYVVDFLDFRVWPVFNVADASICLGAFLFAFHLLTGERTGGKK